MQTKQRGLFIILALVAALGLAAPAGAETRADKVGAATAGQMPGVRIKHWQSSSVEEKGAFLFGFVTMMELEKEWQGKPLPLKQSLTSCWVKGLAGVTIKDMRDAVDTYAAAHPEDGERQVVEVLWLHFVQPKLTPWERKDVAAAYKASRAGR